jgi:hypothetical protein
MTKKEFIQRSQDIHKGKYQYSVINLTTIRFIEKVPIMCPEHGVFYQQARMHIAGQGCPICAAQNRAAKVIKWTIERFIEEASRIHQNKYNYDKVILPSIDRRVMITCPIHGDFEQFFSSHLRGSGCPKCGRNRVKEKLSIGQACFIERAKNIHEGNYLYDKTQYVNGNTPVIITCKKHGDFTQVPRQHLVGQGCPQCGIEKSGREHFTQEEFIKRSRFVHGSRYEYPEEYKGSNSPIRIICPDHGDFRQSPNYHWGGGGCPKCGNRRKGAPWGIDEFLLHAKETHGGKYEYDKSTFTRMRDKIRIICPIHGEFWQVCQMHVYGQGCPSCGNSLSKGEKEILDWLADNGFQVKSRSRDILPSGKELDVYLPDYKLAIEYNGVYWHSSRASDNDGFNKNRHFQKMEECSSLGIRLLQFWDIEWNTKKDICKEIILFALGKIIRRIYARKCEIQHISTAEANKFLNDNHIQGGCKSNIRLGLFFENELVGLQCYQAPNKGGSSGNNWLLIRTVFFKGTQVIGGISRLFKTFLTEASPECVIDYTDRRLFEASGHHQMGFIRDKDVAPCSYLTNGIDLFSRRHYRHWGKRHFKYKMPWDDALTDTENLANNGWYWVWDCGKIKNIWKRMG